MVLVDGSSSKDDYGTRTKVRTRTKTRWDIITQHGRGVGCKIHIWEGWGGVGCRILVYQISSFLPP